MRQYREVTVRSETQPAPAAPGPETTPDASGALRWDAPETWVESLGSGMRLASFSMTSPDGEGQCTMVVLAGAAGGLEANIKRWFGQVGLDVPGDDEFKAFVNNQERFTTRGGFPVVLVDLSVLSPGQAGSSDSMVTAVVTVGTRTLFVKLTGPRSVLGLEKPRLVALCQSLRVEP